MVGEEKACGDEGNPVTRNQKHVVPKKTAIIKSLVGTCFGSLGTHKPINAPPPSHLILSLLRNANDFLLHISFFCLPLSALSSSVPLFKYICRFPPSFLANLLPARYVCPGIICCSITVWPHLYSILQIRFVIAHSCRLIDILIKVFQSKGHVNKVCT